MREEDAFGLIEAALEPLGSRPEVGEDYNQPRLDVARYYQRAVRLHWMPWVGRCRSVTAIVRHPSDLPVNASGYAELRRRLALAVNGRFPPWPPSRGLTIGLTTIVLGTSPVQVDEADWLAAPGKSVARTRVVPLGTFRLDLANERMAMTLTQGPIEEPQVLADALGQRFALFLPRLER